MSVLIKGMEMPTSCRKCMISQPDGCGWICPIIENKPIVDGRVNSRHPHCHLTPVPPHGDSIDRAALWMEINKICDRRDAGIITDLTCLQQLLSAVRHAPTILQADDPKLSATIKCGGVVTCKEYVDTAGELRWTVTHSGKQQPGRGG